MPSSAGQDRREHPRHPASAHVRVTHAHKNCDGYFCDGYLKDISLNGARLVSPEPIPFEEGDQVALVMTLNDLTPPIPQQPSFYFLNQQVQQVIRLKGTMIFRRDKTFGVEYQPVNEVDQLLLMMLLSRP